MTYGLPPPFPMVYTIVKDQIFYWIGIYLFHLTRVQFSTILWCQHRSHEHDLVPAPLVCVVVPLQLLLGDILATKLGL